MNEPRPIRLLSPVGLYHGLIRCWVALGLILAVLAPSSAQTIAARGAEHDDFGRLVFDFTEPVVAAISAEGSHMVLRFDRAAPIDLRGAVANLKNYVGAAKLSADQRRLDLDFTAPVTWRAFNEGAKVAVDFAFADDSSQQQLDKGPDAASARIRIGPGPAAVAAPQNKAAAKAPPPELQVKLRAGNHKGYSRLAFDWPKDVPYQITQSGDRAALHFGNPAAIDLNSIAGDLPPRLNSIGVAPTSDGISVDLELKPGVVLRDFRAGHTVVLDIYDADAANLPPASKSAAASQAGADELQPIPEESVAGPPAMPGSGPAPTPETAGNQAPTFSSLPGVATQLQSAMPEPAASPPANPNGGVTGPGVAVPVVSSASATFEPPRVAPRPVEVKVTALPSKDGATLYFDWPKRVALAVFRRSDSLWIAFDVPGRGDLRPLQHLAPIIGKLELVSSPFSFALRLVGGAAAAPTATTEGTRWKIALQPGTAIAPTQEMEQRRETLPGGGTSVYVQAIASGAQVDLKDPADGSRLVVTPEQLAGMGIARESDWPDFQLLPSYQGVVVAPLTEAAKIQSGPNGVVITTPAPGAAAEASTAPTASILPLTEPPTPSQPAAPAVAPAAPTTAVPATTAPAPAAIANSANPLSTVTGLFELAKWRRGGPATFMDDQTKLQNRVYNAAPADRQQALLDLAEFYLANGYNAEASGQAEIIRREDHNADSNPLIMAIGLAAHTMAEEYDDAERMLAAPALQGVPEANLMRAVIAAVRGRSDEAAKLFAGPLPDLTPYPKAFRTRVRVLAAKALLDNGDPLTAQNYLDPLKNDAPDPDAAARGTYLDGVRELKLGHKDAAMQIWQGLVDSPVDEIKARANFSLVSEQLNEKKIDPQDAVKELEALRFLWRGDTFEFDLLYKLGKLYFDVGEPRKSLLTLRQAATHFPDHPLAKQAADDMTTEFRQLYLGGGADRLSPLTALGLYDEFRELTPTGADGDRMIAALADRLVGVNLLDRAGDLLERQVATRLSGLPKATAGTRLAAIRLLDDKPDLALKALQASDDPAATPDLQAERHRLQARALFDTGDTLKGLALVRDDASLEGLWVKSDMFWRLREWPSAADALGQLIEAEQARRAAATTASKPTNDIATNPASVLDKALAQAQAAAAADAASNPPAANAANSPPAANAQPATPPPSSGPQFDPVLARLVLNRAVALSLASDRRGLKELGRSFGKQMATTALADPFNVLTSPDSGLTESITAQMKSVDQLGVFDEQYKKMLQDQSLSGGTEPNPDTGPLAPLDRPAAPSGSAQPAPPAAPAQTAQQAPAQPSGQ